MFCAMVNLDLVGELVIAAICLPYMGTWTCSFIYESNRVCLCVTMFQNAKHLLD